MEAAEAVEEQGELLGMAGVLAPRKALLLQRKK